MATISPTVVNCPKETHTSKGGYLRLTITSIADSDATTNQRTIGTKVTIQGTAWVQLYAWSVKLGGKVITENISTSGSIANWSTGYVLATKTLTFDNDSSGNLTVQAYVKQLFYYGMGDASRWNNSKFYQLKTADLVCSQLPRYTSFSTHAVDNTTLNTATIKWSAPDTVDKQEYSLDGGTWTEFTGSSYTLTGLSPGSTHKVQTRIRRQDSQLTTTSEELSFTLKSLPTSNNPSNINLGSKQTVSISSVSYLTKWICEIYDGSTKIKEDTNITTTSKEIDISASTIVSGMLSRHTSDNEWNLTYKFKVVSNGITYNLTDRTAKITIPTGQYAPTYNISSVSYAVTDATSNNITGSNQKVIKGISDVQFTIGAATPNGSASMSRYIVSTGDKSVSVNSAASMSASISDVSSKSFSVQAVDSRGRSTTVSKDYSTYIDYFKPTVTNYSIVRKDAIMANLVFNITGKFCNWSGLQVANTISAVKYQYKTKSSSTYSSEIDCTGITISGDSFTVSCTGTGDLINISNEYDIKINIYDKLSSISFTVSIGTGKALLWRDLANTRIGIGKKPTCTLDVNGNFAVSGTVSQLKRNSGGSWIDARENCVVRQTKHTTSSGSSWNPVVGVKTANGHWSIGNVGDERLIFSYDTDTNYDNNSNTSTTVNLPNTGGTIALLSTVYPVGSIYMSVNATNPKDLFGGTWTQLKNAFLFATNATSGNKGTGSGTGTSTGSSSPATGGSSSADTGSTVLTIDQIPSHSHNIKVKWDGGGGSSSYVRPTTSGTANSNFIANTGGGQGHTHTMAHTHTVNSHSHTVPYLEVYVWKRTA